MSFSLPSEREERNGSIASIFSRTSDAFIDWLKHGALNSGQALRDIRYLARHPQCETIPCSLRKRVSGFFQNIFFAILPPQLHHTKEDLADLGKGNAKQWFLNGYKPWKYVIPNDDYDGEQDRPR